MSWFTDLFKVAGDTAAAAINPLSVVGEVRQLITSYFPPSMSDKDRAELSAKLEELGMKKEQIFNDLLFKGEAALNERIAMYEGTASDLKAIPILGSIMLFLRGSQRPVWGFATLWFDYEWIFNGMAFSARQEMALQIISILVLGFLFGERAIQNIMPLVTEMFRVKGQGDK